MFRMQPSYAKPCTHGYGGSGIVRPAAEEESWLAAAGDAAARWVGRPRVKLKGPGQCGDLFPDHWRLKKTKPMGTVFTLPHGTRSAGARSSSDRHLLAGPVGMIGVTAAKTCKMQFSFLRNL